MDRCHIAAANLLFQYLSTLLYARLLFENALKLAANHFLMHLLEIIGVGVCSCVIVSVSAHVFMHKCLGLFVFQRV